MSDRSNREFYYDIGIKLDAVPDTPPSLTTDEADRLLSSTTPYLFSAVIIAGASNSLRALTQASYEYTEGCDRSPNARGPAWVPQILESVPPLTAGPLVAKVLTSAARHSIPYGVNFVCQDACPESAWHLFRLQFDEDSRMYYGASVTRWTESNSEFTLQYLNRFDPSSSQRTLWVPYTLTFLSRHQISTFMVDSLLLLTRPRAGFKLPDLASSDMQIVENYKVADGESSLQLTISGVVISSSLQEERALHHSLFWSMYTCLDTIKILGIFEHLICSHGKVVIISNHMSLVSIACEFLRQYTPNWKGFMDYPVHTSLLKKYLSYPGPVVLGVHKRCRSLLKADDPSLLIVDLDHNYTTPLSFFRSSKKNLKRLQTMPLVNALQIISPPDFCCQVRSDCNINIFSEFEYNGDALCLKPIVPPDWWTVDVMESLWKFVRSLKVSKRLWAQENSFIAVRYRRDQRVNLRLSWNEYIYGMRSLSCIIGNQKDRELAYLKRIADNAGQIRHQGYEIKALQDKIFELSQELHNRDIADESLKDTVKDFVAAVSETEMGSESASAIAYSTNPLRIRSGIVQTDIDTLKTKLGNIKHGLRTTFETASAAISSIEAFKSRMDLNSKNATDTLDHIVTSLNELELENDKIDDILQSVGELKHFQDEVRLSSSALIMELEEQYSRLGFMLTAASISSSDASSTKDQGPLEEAETDGEQLIKALEDDTIQDLERLDILSNEDSKERNDFDSF
ncbi:hypothetical protein CANCADRAFT_32972 [Tortispora caseinolytica NRRL Y-17796]|uniref:UDENN domain-containing protein n=1 Tax=Tortispora caseinolytica NRRL Y-17796 TaxID=767744 RepID=A0A1E4T990_9ASCO|nr:hypothetical protein CANCADRAFT_32972 [Tortispora caseinolytica NRRL Y-17796]